MAIASASELRLLLDGYHKTDEINICSQLKGCTDASCPKSKVFGLDFDKIAEKYRIDKKIDSFSSCDIFVTHVGVENKVAFIETKSSEMTVRYLPPSKDEKKAVNRQLRKFNFEKKLLESMGLCINLANDKDLFDRLDVSFVLVVDTVKSDVGTLISDLDLLSEMAFDVKGYIMEELRKKVESVKVAGVKSLFYNCKELDGKLMEIFS